MRARTVLQMSESGSSAILKFCLISAEEVFADDLKAVDKAAEIIKAFNEIQDGCGPYFGPWWEPIFGMPKPPSIRIRDGKGHNCVYR